MCLKTPLLYIVYFIEKCKLPIAPELFDYIIWWFVVVLAVQLGELVRQTVVPLGHVVVSVYSKYTTSANNILYTLSH